MRQKNPLASLIKECLIWLVALGARDTQVEIKLDRGLDECVAHIVAIADPGDGLALDAAAMLQVGLHVSQQLAGMQVIAQAVDNRYPGILSEGFKVLVGKGADHHGVAHAGQHPGAVFNRFSATQLGITR